MDIKIEPPRVRTVTLELTEEEARSMSIWLRDALRADVNTPASSQKIRQLQVALDRIARGL